MKKLVLLIDDDKLPMQYYVKALRQEGFKVEHCLEPDSALDFARKKGQQIDAIVLDIMLSPGKAYKDKKTVEGLKTGIFLSDNLQQLCPGKPVVVLTNVKNEETLNHFEESPQVKVIQKLDCPPFKFVEMLNDIITS